MLIPSDELLTFLRRLLDERVGPYREVHLPVWPADRDSPHAFLAPLRGNARPAL